MPHLGASELLILFMPNLGVPELLIIFVIIIVLFGATRLPNIGKGLGEGIRNFKRGMKSGDEPEQLPGKTDSQ